MAQVYLLCGKTGAGKSTFAEQKQRAGAVKLSLDEWMIQLFGHHMPRDVFQDRLSRCLELMLNMTQQLVPLNIDVVLDGGFWQKQQRQEIREKLHAWGIKVQLYYFDLPEAVLWQRLQQRNQNLPEGNYEITREMFEMFNGWFEVPGEDEQPIRITATA